jgi:hypothetical protein
MRRFPSGVSKDARYPPFMCGSVRKLKIIRNKLMFGF